MKFRFVFWDVLPCTAINRTMMMEAARTSETSVDNYFTRQYIPEDKSELHIRRRENLKSYKIKSNILPVTKCFNTDINFTTEAKINYSFFPKRLEKDDVKGRTYHWE
jgi:hypothetical protein